MTDNLSQQQRSALMSRIKSKNTVPEILVRRITHSLGHRFRLHKSNLPGKPDLVFASRNKVIFVHGCYWHGHNCRRGRPPKSKLEYWGAKIAKNKSRDIRNKRELSKMGWSYLVIWECETPQRDKLALKIQKFLNT